jgi:amidase
MANSMDGQNSILSVVGPIATNAASLRLLTQAFLDQKPWEVDPMVHEMPWRYMEENSINENIHNGRGMEKRGGKLSFGVLRTDGVVNPMPPIKRAIDILVTALENAGHEVIQWDPPSHKTLVETGFNSWIFDGGKDIKAAFALSGEPMSEQVEMFKTLDKEFTASEIAATNVKLRSLKKEYLDYWMSTAQKTSTGRSVDAVICPLAPFPAARPKKYTYYGYSTFVNVLDYTSVTVPVTNVDKNVDVREEGYKALSEQDQETQDDCKFFEDGRIVCLLTTCADDPEIYDGAHVSLQIMGKRLQEEKMLAIAAYVEKILEKSE